MPPDKSFVGVHETQSAECKLMADSDLTPAVATFEIVWGGRAKNLRTVAQ